MNAIELDDGVLLLTARQRDAQGKLTREASVALGTLYDRHAKRLLAYLCTQFPGRGEDLMMTAWMKLLEPNAKFDGGNFRAWLFRVAYNVGISELRKTRLKSIPEGADANDRQPSALDEWVSAEEEQIVNHCLEGLLPLEREVVFRWKQREKHHDIAAALGITRSKSEQLQFAAMKKLRDCAEDAA
jgi:RNA polymerase sigma factor (sigma-70 family)